MRRSDIFRSIQRKRRSELDAFEYDLGDRVFARMRERDVYAVRTACGKKLCGLAAKHYLGCSARRDRNLDVLPREVSAPAGFECLEDGLFRRKTRGIALAGGRTFCVAIGAFRFSKNAFAKTRRSRQRFAYAVNFNDVDAG